MAAGIDPTAAAGKAAGKARKPAVAGKTGARARQPQAAASTPAAPETGADKPAGVRAQAAQATRQAILLAATQVFAEQGFGGGRIEQISKAARSNDRMIYYYFGNKEGLFMAVLEDTYRRFNDAESALVLDTRQPEAALTAVIRFVWSYYRQHPEFITLLNAENLLGGRHIARSPQVRAYSSPVIAITDTVLRSGAALGVFRADLSARDVYLMIAAMAYFYLGNRHTLSSFLGEDLQAPDALAHWEGFVIDAVQRAVRAEAPPAPLPAA
jgi:AcrR family transcriptional regulator